MKSCGNEKENKSDDDWVVNRLILNNPEEFLAKKEKLKFQLEQMPSKFKKGLRYEIKLAEELKVDVDHLTRSILSKKFGFKLNTSNILKICPENLESRTSANSNSNRVDLRRSLKL